LLARWLCVRAQPGSILGLDAASCKIRTIYSRVKRPVFISVSLFDRSTHFSYGTVFGEQVRASIVSFKLYEIIENIMKKLLYISLSLFFFGIFFASFQISYGAPFKSASPSTAESRKDAGDMLNRYRNWLNSKWTDDDAPYAAIRAEIDAKINRGVSPDAIANSVKEISNQGFNNPKAYVDPKVVFTYYYAKYQSTIPAKQVEDPYLVGGLKNIFIIVANHAQEIPHTYNFARLVYLIGEINYFDYTYYLQLGGRLYQKDPNDARIEGTYGQLLFSSGTPENRKRAFELAEDEKKRHPKLAISYAGLGYLYYCRALEQHNVSDAKRSISEYQQYLRIEPPYSYRADKARNGIAKLMKDIVVWGREQKKP
jgi:hypothetical protein